MNSRLSQLQSYPFEKLRALLAGLTPAGTPIRLSIGEPQHATPDLIRDALMRHLDGLSVYPTTAGSDRLRETIAAWFVRRYGLKQLDPRTQVLPVNGTREALFAFGQAVIDPSRANPAVVSPNPFYQIYEGAALLAGAEPLFLNQTDGNGFALDLDSLTERQWERTQLLYVCSPANPSGRVLTLDEWRALFERSDRYGFVIASDECYSEIYDDRAPLGALEAAQQLGRDGFPNLVVFNSLSKRSNAPGLRAGAVAGDATAAQAVSAVSHLSWMRDEPCRAARQHRGVERRSACRRESAAVSPEVRRAGPDAAAGDARAAAGGRLLSLGACAGRRR